MTRVNFEAGVGEAFLRATPEERALVDGLTRPGGTLGSEELGELRLCRSTDPEARTRTGEDLRRRLAG